MRQRAAAEVDTRQVAIPLDWEWVAHNERSDIPSWRSKYEDCFSLSSDVIIMSPSHLGGPGGFSRVWANTFSGTSVHLTGADA